MASRRVTIAPSSLNKPSTGTKSSKGENDKANNSGSEKKSVKSSGTIVKSRYMQAMEKSSLSKSNSMTNESDVMPPPRPSSIKPSSSKPKLARCSVVPMATPSLSATLLEPSLLGKSILQSTFSDGHGGSPDFDVSVIKDPILMQNAVEHERTPENNKTLHELQAFILAYNVAKMEHNTMKLQAQAEVRLLQVMEEEERLYKEVHEKKRKYLLMEKKKQMNEILDMQISAFTPMTEGSHRGPLIQRFTEDYQTLATAIHTKRHLLDVSNCYVQGDGRDFLEKAEASLKKTEQVLVECKHTDLQDSSAVVECVRDLSTASEDITQQMFGAVSELLELSSQVNHLNVQTQQAFEEHQLGPSRTRELFCPPNPDLE